MRLMPPSDARLCPALERAMPADSAAYSDWRRRGDTREALFGDDAWHAVQVVAEWLDSRGRLVVQLDWGTADGRWRESYLHDAAKIR
jgi:hypothetical protein